ncbi:PLP-dependent aminotransferase family protein [Limnochorda pilosa]|uniref:Selenocysteine synthase n=1 Tax=Limnochorda pilosa TaxID=1555112 RepID=A0A0K2SLR5_LIMPI|nr:hypothetical protein [Limnochorda pilosa]BAS28066.1 selenocysteine synthase [Limnochorda pilosa]
MSYWQEALGLPPLINAAGKMTYLGASTLDPSAVAAMGRAAGEYVDMAQLHRAAGRRVAQWAGAEDAVVTSCAAAGIVTAVAACLTGPDLGRARLLPDTSRFARRRVVLQKGHAVDFGMEIVQAVRLTGAIPVEVGSVKRCDPSQMAVALEEPAAAVLYVVSHHAEQDGMLSLEQVVEIASKRGVPVVVDAAAEMDLNRYLAAGASLVVYSGQKAFGGPTSGVVVGRADLIAACRVQDKGIARPMKVSKEAIAGFLRALEQYAATEPADLTRELEARAAALADRLRSALETAGAARYARISLQGDATRPIPRVALDLDPAAGALTASQLVAALEGGSPSIRTRNHQVDSGRILFDVRTLRDDQLEVMARRVGECLTSGGIHHDKQSS